MPPLLTDASSGVHNTPIQSTQKSAPCARGRKPEKEGLGAFLLVLLVHLIFLDWIVTQQLTVSSKKSSGDTAQAIRVQLTVVKSAAQAAPVQKPIVQPKVPIISTTNPATRKVEKAPEPAVDTVTATIPNEHRTQDAALAAPKLPESNTSTAEKTLPPAGTKELLPPTSTQPKDIRQLACRMPKPDYPRRSQQRREIGRVQVQLVIDVQGQILSAEVIRSSGYGALDDAARTAALGAQCAPYREGGQALRVSAIQPFDFIPAE